MAVFNPQNPAQKPEEYLNYSRPISDLSGDMSGKLKIEAAGDVITGGTHLLDTAIKKGIQDKAYELIDPERDKMTEALEKTKADLEAQGQTPGQPQASAVPLPRSDPRKANASW